MNILDVVILLLSVGNAQKELSEENERNASQSSNYYYKLRKANMTADLAISGNSDDTFERGECSGTLDEPKQSAAWWMFTFSTDTVFITNVIINYRANEISRFAGYYLYVSNSSTTKTDGYLCYHHDGLTDPSTNENVNCNHLGQYVIIYNNKTASRDYAILELCKVRIYGCYKGWWNSNCSSPCPATCLDRHCYPGNGSCVWGCNPDSCLNDICDTATGKCTQGCKSGLLGDYCDKECSLGYYGFNCNQSCNGCLADDCDKENGTCHNTSGCKPGWKYGHLKCDQVCESRTFGNNCSMNCYCFNDQCNKTTGTCPPGGCERGYTGITCSTACISGNYGYNCGNSCDGCLSDSCDREFGICTNKSGCKPGRLPGEPQADIKCDTDCNNGTCGDGCLLGCHCQNGFCEKMLGTCPDNKCQPGWTGDTCSEACDDGLFGDGCATQCYCEIEVCNKATGKCPHERCQKGWMGATCSEECNNGTYGFNCREACNSCQNASCERFEGNCTDGCLVGFNGHQCQFSVTPKTDGQATNDNSCAMNIIYAVIGTFIFTTVVGVFIFLAIFRYILGKTDRDAKKQNTKDYVNTTFTSDYADIGNNSTEAHYADAIPSIQEQPYDTI